MNGGGMVKSNREKLADPFPDGLTSIINQGIAASQDYGMVTGFLMAVMSRVQAWEAKYHDPEMKELLERFETFPLQLNNPIPTFVEMASRSTNGKAE